MGVGAEHNSHLTDNMVSSVSNEKIAKSVKHNVGWGAEPDSSIAGQAGARSVILAGARVVIVRSIRRGDDASRSDHADDVIAAVSKILVSKGIPSNA